MSIAEAESVTPETSESMIDNIKVSQTCLCVDTIFALSTMG